MDRQKRRPVSVEDAKARLRAVARGNAPGTAAGGALLGGSLVSAARRRPFAALGAAAAAGFAFGASRRVRAQLLRAALRLLR